VSLGIEVNIVPAAIESAKRHGRPVIAQINPRMPFTFGDGEIALEDIDLAIEIDEALPSPAARRINDTAIAIGEHVARYVEDGSTLQLGIGDIPDAALGQLNHRRHLGVWSEMISDGVLNLERRGVLDTHKPITCSFMFGSPELYEWANANERLLLRRTDIVNDPAEIESRASLVAVNTAVQIDLYAQANATFVRGTVYSGFGGQPDFVSGALHSPRGHAIIALRSWHDPSDASCVVPLLNTPVTTFQHSVLISEQGAAEIFGRSRPEQSELIIDNVAHPRVRDELREAAATLG
jgi:acyl-CoA hydrolase